MAFDDDCLEVRCVPYDLQFRSDIIGAVGAPGPLQRPSVWALQLWTRIVLAAAEDFRGVGAPHGIWLRKLSGLHRDLFLATQIVDLRTDPSVDLLQFLCVGRGLAGSVRGLQCCVVRLKREREQD
jgi:hypothetical protein